MSSKAREATARTGHRNSESSTDASSMFHFLVLVVSHLPSVATTPRQMAHPPHPRGGFPCTAHLYFVAIVPATTTTLPCFLTHTTTTTTTTSSSTRRRAAAAYRLSCTAAAASMSRPATRAQDDQAQAHILLPHPPPTQFAHAHPFRAHPPVSHTPTEFAHAHPFRTRPPNSRTRTPPHTPAPLAHAHALRPRCAHPVRTRNSCAHTQIAEAHAVGTRQRNSRRPTPSAPAVGTPRRRTHTPTPSAPQIAHAHANRGGPRPPHTPTQFAPTPHHRHTPSAYAAPMPSQFAQPHAVGVRAHLPHTPTSRSRPLRTPHFGHAFRARPRPLRPRPPRMRASPVHTHALCVRPPRTPTTSAHTPYLACTFPPYAHAPALRIHPTPRHITAALATLYHDHNPTPPHVNPSAHQRHERRRPRYPNPPPGPSFPVYAAPARAMAARPTTVQWPHKPPIPPQRTPARSRYRGASTMRQRLAFRGASRPVRTGRVDRALAHQTPHAASASHSAEIRPARQRLCQRTAHPLWECHRRAWRTTTTGDDKKQCEGRAAVGDEGGRRGVCTTGSAAGAGCAPTGSAAGKSTARHHEREREGGGTAVSPARVVVVLTRPTLYADGVGAVAFAVAYSL
ncbi:hypothetical protein PLICRDRAFT_178057 [Plicaturopsis crispa FD-325 SS-3]|nr:hypothetical protein PLICRDRAFT_178057 [Plicaturopsis crispa FD-325 SS-3]